MWYFTAVSVRDAVGSKVKVEFIRTVLAEVKTDKYESRILVCFSYFVYYLQQAATAVDYFISFLNQWTHISAQEATLDKFLLTS